MYHIIMSFLTVIDRSLRRHDSNMIASYIVVLLGIIILVKLLISMKQIDEKPKY